MATEARPWADKHTSLISVYTYYNAPWDMKTGDDVRIHTILRLLATSHVVVVFRLSTSQKNYEITQKDGVVYVAVPRKIYSRFSQLIRWRNRHEFNPVAKATLYVDEFIALQKTAREIAKSGIVIIFGSMTIAPHLLKLFTPKTKIIYDPLANYAQTLYLNSRRSILQLLKYAIYLAIHKVQIKASDVVIYPSTYDLNNAKYMFKPVKTTIIQNPIPICYNSIEEYLLLRKRRTEEKPHIVLLAGARGKGNEEAVKETIEIFNKLKTEYKLFITGPWHDYKNQVKNRNIQILGVIPHEKLKELLAVADYGLSPIFTHAAGTFLKMLAYQAADLSIIASPHSLLGLEIKNPKKIRIVHNYEELAKAAEEITQNYKPDHQRRPLMCKDRDHTLQAQIEEAIRHV